MKPIDILNTILQTLATTAPASSIGVYAPMLMTILASGVKFVQAGTMTDAELASLFMATGQHIQTTQAAWDALNGKAT